jgi:hypothetical protein
MEVVDQSKSPLRVAALSLAFLSPAIAYMTIVFSGGNTLLFEDGLLAQFPFRVFLRNAFVNGFSPQWMPNSACGISLLAEGQSGICFPATQIIYRLFSAEVGWIIEILLAQSVAFALCYFSLRQFRFSRVGSLFGSSVYTFCTYAFVATGIPAIMWSYSLLPGIFLASDLFVERRPFAFVYLMIAISLLFLTGHPVMIVYIGMIIAVFLVVHIVRERPTLKTIRKIGPLLFALLGAVLAAMIIASPQLLPILHELPFSARTTGTGMSLETLQNTMHLSPVWAPLSLFPTPPRWGEGGFWSIDLRYPFYALFLGFVGMLFGTQAPRKKYFIFLCIFSILMALGPYIGLWKIVHSLPGLNQLRYPFRWLFFLPLCVSYFSAHGLDHLLTLSDGFRPEGAGRILKSILVVGLTIAAVLVIVFTREFALKTGTALESWPWLTGLLWMSAIGMVIAAFLSLTKGSVQRGLVLGATLTVVSLFATIAYVVQDPMVIRNLETFGRKGDDLPNKPQTFRTSTDLSSYNVWMTNSIRRHYNYIPNLSILNGTLSTGYYFSFFPYWSANVSAWAQEALKGDLKRRTFLDLSSARWLFPADGLIFEKAAFPKESFMGAEAYRNPSALERARIVPSYRLFSNEQDLVSYLGSSKEFDPRRELAILRQDAEAWNLHSDTGGQKANALQPKATIVAERPDRIEIELGQAVTKAAFLVLSDTYYPGWKALVDGVEKKILRVNYAFRGIQLPAGAKHVVFSFDPLVPDAALPLPTVILGAICAGLYFRHFLIMRRRTG